MISISMSYGRSAGSNITIKVGWGKSTESAENFGDVQLRLQSVTNARRCMKDEPNSSNAQMRPRLKR